MESGGEDALVLRPQAEVEVRSLPPGAAEFLAALADGRKLIEAARSAMGVERLFDLATNIAALIDAGAFVDCSFTESTVDADSRATHYEHQNWSTVVAFIAQNIRSIIGVAGKTAWVFAPPLLRNALAVPFFKSGLTKWSGFLSLSPAAEYLFEDEFKLHIFGQAYTFPFPDTLALIASIAEIVLLAFLVVALATRFSAFGLLVMTGVIQLEVPEGWANFHLPWAALAVAIIALGPGPQSLDALIEHLWHRVQDKQQ